MRWWILAALLAATGAAHAADLSLRRVVLSSGGVGYFEYAASVDGDATLSLDVPLDQVDDILKSLVVYDPSGTVGELTLPGREPLQQGFADLPFGREALRSLPDLLNTLQGAELKIGGGKPMEGRLLRVVDERALDRNGVAVTRHRVSLLTKNGIEQFILEDADTVAFADPILGKQVASALSLTAAYRAKGLRHLSLESRGSGTRTVRVGYVVGVPLWKASYRLSLPESGESHEARLQGWAVLENFSGHAWKGVRLTLLSGNPVTFRQALYESYYVTRPSVPVEVAGHVLPPPDTGSLAAAAKNAATERLHRAPLGAPKAFAMPLPAPPPPPARIEAAAAAENATETSFTLPYKVDVAAGQSLVVPILDRTLPARRVDLYEPAADPRHPLAAIAIENNGGTGLPPGVLTLYEQSAAGAVYLGDARLAAFPSREKRILSYALDTKLTIDRTSSQRNFILSAATARGVMHVKRRVQQTTIYRIATAHPGERDLIIEEPRIPGWRLAAPDPAQVALTADAYRIPVTVSPNKVTALKVVLERPVEEAISLTDLGEEQLGVFAASTELAPSLKKALGEIAARRQQLAERDAELKQLTDERRQLVADETRLRANLAAVGHDTALYKETLDRLGRSEDEITKLSAAIAKADAALAALRAQLETFISGLTL
jgi:hypothetical protein